MQARGQDLGIFRVWRCCAVALTMWKPCTDVRLVLKSTIIRSVLLTLIKRLSSLHQFSGLSHFILAQASAKVMIWLDRCAAPQPWVSSVCYGGSMTVWACWSQSQGPRYDKARRETRGVSVCCALSTLISVAKPSIKLPWQPSVHHPIHHPRATDRATQCCKRCHGRVER